MVEKIKEYLVSIGFSTDEKGASKAQSTVDSIGKTVKGLSAAIKALAVGGTLQKIVGYFTDMARQDLAFQRTARAMWTTKDNAEAITRSLNVLGASLQDLWLNPELAGQFRQLRQEALEMQAPDELSGQLKEVRSILFEVSRFKLTLQYLGQWVAYFFLTYLERPLAKLKKTIQGDTDSLQKNLPNAADKIGQALAAVFRLVLAALKLIHSAWDALPKDVIAGLLAIAAVAKMISAGPVGILIGMLLAALALYEDYLTWADGGVSLIDWGQAQGALDTFRAAWDDFKADFGESWETFSGGIGKVVDAFGRLFDALGGWDTVAGIFSAFLETLGWIVDTVGKLADALGEVFGWIADIIEAVSGAYDKISGFFQSKTPEGAMDSNFLQGTDTGSIASIVNPTGSPSFLAGLSGGGADTVAQASQSGGTVSVRGDQTQTNTINIYTQDPATAGQSVATELDGTAAWFDGSVKPAY